MIPFLPVCSTIRDLFLWQILFQGTFYVFKGTVEIVYNEHKDQAECARYNRFSL